MCVISGATLWMLPELSEGVSASERLAAIAILQKRPDPRYVQWLAERCRPSRMLKRD